MKSENTILDEIREISPLLAEIQNINVFTVPEGYFSYLSATIQEKIITDDIKEFSTENKAGSTVPHGYFDTLSKRILDKVRDEEDAVGVLEGIGRENVFAVPDGYFEKLPEAILQKTREDKKSKVVPIYRKPFFKYAMAAAVAVVLFVGVLIKPDSSRHDTFSVVSNKTVLDKGALRYNSQAAFDDGLASLSTQQIITYLNSQNSMMNQQQVINSANTSDMPQTLDYLSDENTLEKYLNAILAEEATL